MAGCLCMAVIATLSLLACNARAQTITARNWTAADTSQENNNAIQMSVSQGETVVPLAAVLPLTRNAAGDIPPPGLSGPVILADANNQLKIQHDNIASISCDASAYAGNIGAIDVFGTAEQANASAIVWYSRYADWCDLQNNSGEVSWIYTMKSANDSLRMIDQFSSGGSMYVSILPPDSAVVETNASTPNGDGGGSQNSNSNNNQNSSQGPLGPSPSTAVAMIILYSITGIITALFLVIIVTGAIRAHRHPERYGPRMIAGRARQSRARGLARAMLDTIPIVKFGEREPPKNTDVELAGASANSDAPREAREATAATGDGATDEASAGTETAEPRYSTAEGGIAAASAPAGNKDASTNPDNQGCSICTEDFQLGEDQRVLPCNHRFHPACIDPWLLNVSGTCPLCRVDLRPQTSRTSADGEVDENGNPVPRSNEGDDLPPPLGAEGQDLRRPGVRRSLMLSLLGTSNRMSREERLEALRQYRMQEAAQEARRRSQQGSSSAQVGESSQQQEESGLRSRLSRAFRIRTRRTGQEEAVATPTVPETVNEENEDERRRQGASDGPT